MPKLSTTRLPRYCKHKQSGQAVVYLDGRDVLLGTHGTAASRQKYQQVIVEWLATSASLRVDGRERVVRKTHFSAGS